MKIQRFPIDGEDPARLELHWEGMQIHVHFDGVRRTTLEGWRGLKEGWSTQLEDGSTLEVRTVRRVIFSELSVLRNGRHVASSPSHPDKILKSSSNSMLFVTAVFMVSGLTLGLSAGWIDLLFGVFYFAGALLLRRGRRLGAALIGVPLFLRLDILLLAIFMREVDGMWAIELGLNLLFATFVIRAWQAANEKRMLAGGRAAAVVPAA